MATIKDVAWHAVVLAGRVSNVLNRQGYVAPSEYSTPSLTSTSHQPKMIESSEPHAAAPSGWRSPIWRIILRASPGTIALPKGWPRGTGGSMTVGGLASRSLLDRASNCRPQSCALIAMGLLMAFVQLGIRVPEDVSVVGFADLSCAATAVMPLTTVRQSRAKLGRWAVRMLMEEIDRGDTHEHRHELLESELVVRSTTGAPRALVIAPETEPAFGGSR